MAQRPFGRNILSAQEKQIRADEISQLGANAAASLLRRETPVETKNTNLGIANEENLNYEDIELNTVATPLEGIDSIDSIDKQILKDKNFNVLAQTIADRGGILPDTKASTEFSKDPAVLDAALEKERKFQLKENDLTGNRFLPAIDEEGNEILDTEGNQLVKPFNVLDTEKQSENDISSVDKLTYNLQKARDGLELKSSQDTVSNFIARGEMFRSGLQTIMQPMLLDNSPLGAKVNTVLRNTNIVDSNGNFTAIAGNAVTASFLQVLKDIINKEDTRITKAERQLAENEMTAENLDRVRVTRQSLANDKIDPNEIRNGLAAKVIDKMTTNPNQQADGVSTGFGGMSSRISADVLSALDTYLYSLLTQEDLIAKVPDEEMIVISSLGETFFENTREILDDLNIRDLTLRSKLPFLFPGQERVTGRKKKGDVSQSNKMSTNITTEQLVKNVLASVPLTIIPERFEMARLMVESIIISDDGENVKGFKGEVEGGRRYSTATAAKTLGLDKGKWHTAYQTARKNMSDSEAARTANLIMIREAKKILKLMRFAAEEVGGVYYNKQFHASSVGRFFVRNTDINPQLSKLARMFVGNANTVIINPKVDKGQAVFKDWAYIIGKNLMPLTRGELRDRTLTGDVRTEDMGWNAIQKPALEIINNPNHSAYKEWVAKGRLLSEKGMEVIQGRQGLEALKKAVGVELFNSVFDSEGSGNAGEWGYPFQSYLDMYAYDNAMKKGGAFKPKAQVQHDGKQNGIAIQAMQFGREHILTLTGILYNDESNVIPFGDLRDRFLTKMSTGIKIAFLHDKPRQEYWLNVLGRIQDSSDIKTIGKDLSKTPLMETSYGKYEGFNEETALNFIDKYGEDLIKGSPDGIGTYLEDDMIQDLNSVITETLRETLNLRSQQIMKTAGEMWAMLGVDASLQGPLGTTIYMGSYERQNVVDLKTGELTTMPIQLNEGVVNVPLTRMQSTSSARSRNRKMVRDNKAKYGWRLEEQTKYGQEVGNQLPVLTIQQIDAAVMANTIKEVNKDRYDVGKPPKFVIPIHDAIITDATSVRDYHSTINRQFRQTNNEYSVTKAIYEGLTKAKSKAITELGRNPEKEEPLNYDSKFRAIHDALVRLVEKEKNKDKPTKETDEERIGGIRKQVNLKQKNPANLLLVARAHGWKEDGSGFVKHKHITALINEFFLGNNILAKLREENKMAQADRGKLYNRILAMILYQYN